MIKYIVDKDKRFISAYFSDGRYGWYRSLQDLIAKYMPFPIWDDEYTDIVYNVIKDMNLYGIAKCHPKDEWDEDTGKEIAKRRLVEKYKRASRRVLAGLYKKIIVKNTNSLWRISARLLRE